MCFSPLFDLRDSRRSLRWGFLECSRVHKQEKEKEPSVIALPCSISPCFNCESPSRHHPLCVRVAFFYPCLRILSSASDSDSRASTLHSSPKCLPCFPDLRCLRLVPKPAGKAEPRPNGVQHRSPAPAFIALLLQLVFSRSLTFCSRRQFLLPMFFR